MRNRTTKLRMDKWIRVTPFEALMVLAIVALAAGAVGYESGTWAMRQAALESLRSVEATSATFSR
jgi:hypothetical protein